MLRLIGELFLACWLLGGIGFVAIGASGGLAAGVGELYGKRIVAGDPPGVTYTAERCEDFTQYHPEATTCSAAAIAHHYDEVVGYRLSAGILGVLALGAYGLIGRRLRPARRALPETFVATAGAALYGGVGAVLVAMSAMQLAFGPSDGSGNFLSGGIVSFLLGAVFALSLLRTLARAP
jgi:hypothetical protein